MDNRETCAACGHVGYDVQLRVVLIEKSGKDEYQVEPRCIDHEACLDRQAAEVTA